MKLKVSLFVMLAITFAGCVDIPDFDNTPKIYYNGIDHYTVVDDSTGQREERIILTVDFEDGDGDLGISDAERSDTTFTRAYGNWGNYELITVRKELNGQWTEYIADEDRFKWMPILKPDGKAGPLKGKLDLNSTAFYSNSTTMITVKYKVRIRDRALRVSNQIETDTIQIPGFR
jgi:hypothetical protein